MDSRRSEERLQNPLFCPSTPHDPLQGPQRLCPRISQRSSSSAGDPATEGQGGHRRGISYPRLLLSFVCGSKNLRRVQTHHRLIHPQQVRYHHQVQDGDSQNSHVHHSTGLSLDLKDAYLQVSIHPDSWHLLHFPWEGYHLKFRVLCFGLSTAPQVFTRVMAPISAEFHRLGFHILKYLGNWLVLAS